MMDTEELYTTGEHSVHAIRDRRGPHHFVVQRAGETIAVFDTLQKADDLCELLEGVHTDDGFEPGWTVVWPGVLSVWRD